MRFRPQYGLVALMGVDLGKSPTRVRTPTRNENVRQQHLFNGYQRIDRAVVYHGSLALTCTPFCSFGGVSRSQDRKSNGQPSAGSQSVVTGRS